jgi:predicted RNase H-like HicB family nuclease
MINLELPQSNLFSNLKVTLLLESLRSGEIVASIREFPDCRVQAETREKAIAKIQATFLEKLQNIEAISWDVPLPNSQPAWMEFAGIFKDDEDFASIMDSIYQERNSNLSEEIDPSYYL